MMTHVCLYYITIRHVCVCITNTPLYVRAYTCCEHPLHLYIFYNVLGGANGNLRLVGGNTMFEGRVEICFDSRWRTVSDSGWDDQDATVVCRQLGFSDQGVPWLT